MKRAKDAPGLGDAGLEASYAYDLLDNLSGVTQGVQSRNFGYDSLKRLREAKGPETQQAAIGYTYDDNGNLIAKTEPGGTAAVYTYDVWDRLKQKSYTGSVTLAADLCWDGQTHNGSACTGSVAPSSQGRLTGSGNSDSWTAYAHDARGRVTSATQSIKRADGTSMAVPAVTYQYWADGNLANLGYPSGRQVVTCYDALGRAQWVSGANSMNDCTDSNHEVAGGYWKNATYLPGGAVQQAKLGNGAIETAHYNSRLQPDVQELTKGSSLWKLETAYGLGSRRNVGNVLKQTLTVSGVAGSLVTGYQYDALDRLTTATEQPANADNPACTGAGSGTWCREYGLDGYGNRRIAQQYPAGDGTG